MDEIKITNAGNALTLDEACALEWLDTNALAGYASSTILNCHTRKYHGLLVAKLEEPYGKFVLLSTLEDALVIGDEVFLLTAHEYEGADAKGGLPYFQSFELDTHPVFSYAHEKFQLTKEILMPNGQNTVFIRYTLKNLTKESITLAIKPLLAYRNFNSLQTANNAIDGRTDVLPNGIRLSPYQGMPSMFIYTSGNTNFTPGPLWYYHFLYEQEKLRGYAYEEDLFTPGTLTLNFDQSQSVILACTVETHTENNLQGAFDNEISYRKNSAQHNAQDKGLTLLRTNANQFLVRHTSDAEGIIAGYHWFHEWGRDAMISAAGLLLHTGQEKVFLDVLNHFATYEFKGLIPNRIAPNSAEENDYDSVDTSLWFCHAVQQYYLKTKDTDSIRPFLWETMKNIVRYYHEGTLFNIKQWPNGLIYAGNPDIKTTWMDVVINGKALTPRNGAQVEVNALWYNALCFMAELARKFKDTFLNELEPLAALVQKNYLPLFWNAELGCLYDFINDEEANAKIRPNQIFALSLPYSPINNKDIAQKILTVVKNSLLTPYGLRSLDPKDPSYKGIYAGNQTTRDTAYHNGTVWPWLLAHFAQALINVYSKETAQQVLQNTVKSLDLHLTTQAGLGGISEVFDGDAPHHPGGCIQQAWSVGELIRLKYLLD